MHCFHCKNEISFTDKIGRRDTCDHCSSDIHVCKNCEFYDPSSYNECREPSAERVKDKEKSNFCDYFKPSGQAQKIDNSKSKALSDLENLFKK